MRVKDIGGDLRIVNNPALSECLVADFAASISAGCRGGDDPTILNNNKSDLRDWAPEPANMACKAATAI